MGLISRVREINARYRRPQVKMTPGVKAALLLLRVYLVLLLGILAFKFITLVTGR
jgi:hypothetical protein